MELDISEALDACCKKMIDGNGLSWDEMAPSIKHGVRVQMVGPLHAAVEALKPQIEAEYLARLAVLS